MKRRRAADDHESVDLTQTPRPSKVKMVASAKSSARDIKSTPGNKSNKAPTLPVQRGKTSKHGDEGGDGSEDIDEDTDDTKTPGKEDTQGESGSDSGSETERPQFNAGGFAS